MNRDTILVTGSAGFIGSSLIRTILNYYTLATVIGIDNICPYYDIKLKFANLNRNKDERFINYIGNIADKSFVDKVFKEHKITMVFHLAAQAGVRYSFEHPKEVISSNIVGFQNILDACIEHNVNNIIYASSSSVYGDFYDKENCKEDQLVDNQKSPYAVTKRCNELMANTYSSNYPNLHLTGLRFFTVYGPYMRPDLAIGKFTKAILNDEPIEIYGDGSAVRDFTYISDIVNIMYRIGINIMNKKYGHEIFNIGAGKCITVNELVDIIKENINPNFDKIVYTDKAKGDVNKTLACIDKINEWFGEKPQVEIHEGIKKYIEWYKTYGCNS